MRIPAGGRAAGLAPEKARLGRDMGCVLERAAPRLLSSLLYTAHGLPGMCPVCLRGTAFLNEDTEKSV